MSDERRSLLRLGAVGALAFMLVVYTGGGRGCGAATGPAALVDTPAPPFSADVVAGEGSGADRVTLASLAGQPVLLDFWASWCGPCRISIPVINRVAARHRDAGLRTYGINIESNRPATFVASAHRSFRATFPSLLDPDWQIQTAFRVESIPTVVLLDREGTVRYASVGMPDEPDLDRRITALLSAH